MGVVQRILHVITRCSICDRLHALATLPSKASLHLACRLRHQRHTRTHGTVTPRSSLLRNQTRTVFTLQDMTQE